MRASTIQGMHAGTIQGMHAGTIHGMHAGTIHGMRSKRPCLNLMPMSQPNVFVIQKPLSHTRSPAPTRRDARLLSLYNASEFTALTLLPASFGTKR